MTEMALTGASLEWADLQKVLRISRDPNIGKERKKEKKAAGCWLGVPWSPLGLSQPQVQGQALSLQGWCGIDWHLSLALRIISYKSCQVYR